MNGWGRAGIALGIIGLMVILIGLFPAIVGIVPTPGIGIVKITVILIGFTILIVAALVFIQSVFYPGIAHNLGQQIGIRLSLTGLLASAAAGYADVLGYGSNPPTASLRPILGPYQTAGLIGGFVVAAFGVLIFALAGLYIAAPSDSPVEEAGEDSATLPERLPVIAVESSSLPDDPELAPALDIQPDSVSDNN